MAGETNLQVAPQSTAATGPVSVGANFTPSFYAPFAVGRGASATASGSDGTSNVLLYAALGLGALILVSAIIYSRKK